MNTEKAVKLLENAPSWILDGSCVDLRRGSDYWQVLGNEFCSFFSQYENTFGKNVKGWNWEVRRTDGLVNLIIWKQ